MADVVLNQKRLMIVASSVVVLTMVGMLFLGRWNLGPKEEGAESAAGNTPAVEEMVDETLVDDDFQAEPPVQSIPAETPASQEFTETKDVTPEPVNEVAPDPEPPVASTPSPPADTPAPKPEPESKTGSSAPWTLQVGAFSSEDSARSITRILKKNGHKAWYKSKDGLYKVFVGRYASRDAAVAQRDDLEASMKGMQQVPNNRPFPVQE